MRNRAVQTSYALLQKLIFCHDVILDIQNEVEEAFDFGEVHVTMEDIQYVEKCVNILKDILDAGPTISQIGKYNS